MENRWFVWGSLFALASGVAMCFWALHGGGTTPRESILLSLFLTLLSVAASWIASRYYADYSFNKNLRTFALKASEKVNNLSLELDRLSAFLQQELNAGENGEMTAPEALRLKDARIESAIHMLATLKSVNDRSLSDWQGVIGDEIDAQRRQRREQEKDLKRLLGRLESLYATHPQAGAVREGGETTTGPAATLEREVEALRDELSLLATQIGGVPPVRRAKPKAPREEVRGECPNCLQSITYRQRAKKNSVIPVTCPQCDASLFSHYNEGIFSLQMREAVPESVACPTCTATNVVTLDPMPGSPAVETNCVRCGSRFRALRTGSGVGVKPVSTTDAASSAPPTLTENVLEAVRGRMPAQPWHKGAAREAAAQLGLPLALVNDAIEELTRRGVFKIQVDGTLYVPEPAVRTPVAAPVEAPPVVRAGRS